MLKKFSLLVVLALVAAVTVGIFYKIDRTDLHIGNAAEENCEAYPIRSFRRVYAGKTDYNQELVADEFSVFGAYAANAYSDEIGLRPFHLNPAVYQWTERNFRIYRTGGFDAHIYSKDDQKNIDYMIVFRGTDGVDMPDILSDLNPIFQMLNPWDQYRTARRQFSEMREIAKREANGRIIRYVAVGHSLGGGLARHMAAAFPCTSALAFNSSFVENTYRLEQRYDGLVVDIYEDGDPVTKAAKIIRPNTFKTTSASHVWYRVNVSPDVMKRLDLTDMAAQHGILRLPNRLSRMALDCKGKYLKYKDCPDQICEIDRPTSEVRDLFCVASKIQHDGVPPICAQSTAWKQHYSCGRSKSHIQ
jgi:hypothetical protein